jgi:hypothetical protein
MSRNKCLFPVSNITYFMFYIRFLLFTDSPAYYLPSSVWNNKRPDKVNMSDIGYKICGLVLSNMSITLLSVI